MTDIVLATSNPHKIEEMNAIFAGLLPGRVRFLSLAEARPGFAFAEPVETGATFEANASIKALSYAAQSGKLCLADDSGLEIDALAGKPGVISSHYCTDGRETGMTRPERDAANNARVLRELEAVLDARRTARFVCVMTLAAPVGGVMASVRGTFEGRIALGLRGEGGFGYDPLFLVEWPHGSGKTVSSAQLPPNVKNALSHRGAAARLLADELLKLGLLG